ncbi:MAG: DUF58 domain-containing protein [Spirochaetales bacterium]|nr:MAG: DUF58 domain-containing protein [Spirochaetales bacterium]
MTKIDPGCAAIVAAFRRRNLRSRAPSAVAARDPMFRRRGSSFDLKSIREYQSFDDPRAIDWKLYGRTDRAYVKEFYDEASEGIAFLIDGSGSMSIPDCDEYRSCIASLAFILTSLGMGVNSWIFDRALRGNRISTRHPSDVRRLIEALDGMEANGPTDTTKAYLALRSMRGERRIFVFSDFHETLPRLAPPSAGSLFLIRFRVPFPSVAPSGAELEIEDPENGELVVVPWDRAEEAAWRRTEDEREKRLSSGGPRAPYYRLDPGQNRMPVYRDILERLYG